MGAWVGECRQELTLQFEWRAYLVLLVLEECGSQLSRQLRHNLPGELKVRPSNQSSCHSRRQEHCDFSFEDVLEDNLVDDGGPKPQWIGSGYKHKYENGFHCFTDRRIILENVRFKIFRKEQQFTAVRLHRLMDQATNFLYNWGY